MKFGKLCVGLLLVFLLGSSLLSAQDGQTLFKSKCAICHGPDAAGKTAMGEKLQIKDLRAPEIQKQSDAELAQSITKGKGKMGPQESKLTKDQVPTVVGFIREIAKTK